MSTSVFKAGQPVSIVVPLPVLDGASVPLTAFQATVRDEADVVLGTIDINPTPVGEATYSLEIPSQYVTLADGVTSGARTVSTVMTTAAGSYRDEQVFLLVAERQLVVLKNSFVTYPMALMTRNDLPVLHGWDAADEASRIAALKIAHASMLNLRYRYPAPQGYDYNRVTDYPDLEAAYWSRTGSVYVGNLMDIPADDYASLPAVFKTALARAQVTEADHLLNEDSVAAKRRAGIVSETIGESSMFLRQSPEVRMAISLEAMSHLKGMIVRRSMQGRGS